MAIRTWNSTARGAASAFMVPAFLRSTAVYGLVALVLPVAAYIFCAERFEFLGPRLNLDLLAICIAGIFIARRAPRVAPFFVVAGIAFALTIQFALGLGAVYVDDPALLAEYFSFIAFWPWRLIISWLSVALAVLAMLYFVLSRIDIRNAHMMPFALLLLACGVLDLASRTEVGFRLVGDNLATSSAVRAFKLARTWSSASAFRALPIEQPMMVREVDSAGTPDKIMSLSVEAFGLFQDRAVNEQIVASLRRALGNGFDVEAGRHPFKGATLSGEMRELCNVRTAGTPRLADARALQPRCLPAHLAARGFATLGIHGNSGFFYNRRNLYPTIGFGQTLFYDDLMTGPRPAHRCKTRAFEGVCDQDTVGAALEHLSKPGRRYAHVMTLDTHFPLGVTALGDERCGLAVNLSDPDLCLYANQMATLLGRIGKQIASAPVVPDAVYIFGDHAPPYVVATKRHAFDRKHVPFIVIRRVERAS